jgi:tetratricopeptide (TPR) repeat protein
MFVFLLLLALNVPNFAAQISKYGKKVPANGHLIKDVPYQEWEKSSYCGPAAMAMVLSYWGNGKPYSQDTIAKEIYNFQKEISFNSALVFYPRSVGMLSYSFNGDMQLLKEILKQDIPVIVLHKPIKQINKGHYRVVIGFDEDKQRMIFHDPLIGKNFSAKYDVFDKLWHWGDDLNKKRWALVILPKEKPFDFPYVKNHYLTDINLATAYYKRGSYNESLEEWEKARDKNPSDPYPLYSISMVHIRLGNNEKALDYAQKAVALDDKNAFSLDVLGLAYLKLGQVQEAMNVLGKAMKLAPRSEFIQKHYLQARDMHIESSKTKE